MSSNEDWQDALPRGDEAVQRAGEERRLRRELQEETAEEFEEIGPDEIRIQQEDDRFIAEPEAAAFAREVASGIEGVDADEIDVRRENGLEAEPVPEAQARLLEDEFGRDAFSTIEARNIFYAVSGARADPWADSFIRGADDPESPVSVVEDIDPEQFERDRAQELWGHIDAEDVREARESIEERRQLAEEDVEQFVEVAPEPDRLAEVEAQAERQVIEGRMARSAARDLREEAAEEIDAETDVDVSPRDIDVDFGRRGVQVTGVDDDVIRREQALQEQQLRQDFAADVGVSPDQVEIQRQDGQLAVADETFEQVGRQATEEDFRQDVADQLGTDPQDVPVFWDDDDDEVFVEEEWLEQQLQEEIAEEFDVDPDAVPIVEEDGQLQVGDVWLEGRLEELERQQAEAAMQEDIEEQFGPVADDVEVRRVEEEVDSGPFRLPRPDEGETVEQFEAVPGPRAREFQEEQQISAIEQEVREDIAGDMQGVDPDDVTVDVGDPTDPDDIVVDVETPADEAMPAWAQRARDALTPHAEVWQERLEEAAEQATEQPAVGPTLGAETDRSMAMGVADFLNIPGHARQVTTAAGLTARAGEAEAVSPTAPTIWQAEPETADEVAEASEFIARQFGQQAADDPVRTATTLGIGVAAPTVTGTVARRRARTETVDPETPAPVSQRTDIRAEAPDPWADVDAGASLRDFFGDDRAQMQIPRSPQRQRDPQRPRQDDRILEQPDLGTPDPRGPELAARQRRELDLGDPTDPRQAAREQRDPARLPERVDDPTDIAMRQRDRGPGTVESPATLTDAWAGPLLGTQARVDAAQEPMAQAGPDVLGAERELARELEQTEMILSDRTGVRPREEPAVRERTRTDTRPRSAQRTAPRERTTPRQPRSPQRTAEPVRTEQPRVPRTTRPRPPWLPDRPDRDEPERGRPEPAEEDALWLNPIERLGRGRRGDDGRDRRDDDDDLDRWGWW